MRKNLTEIVFILDRSGSMSGLERDTIGGFNSMIEQQKKAEGEALISTVLFDNVSEVLHDRVNVKDIRPMTDRDYMVRGCTALLDAIGGAIHHIGNVHKYARPEDVPEHTMFVITTDGMENASRRYNSEKVKQMIERQKAKYGWEFLFLGANIDAVETASQFGIGADRAVNYQCDSEGTALNYEVVSEAISSVRCSAPLSADWKKRMFYRYKPSNKIKIPVYLVDEEIYAKCPTIILSTVDKFARLPWDVNTNALFGRVDRICSRDGYVAIGADHARHNRTEELPTSTLRSIKPFLPPELIIQDELHLITGPLGTVYGAYETVIEDLCSYTIGEKKIKPKYVVSTATIKNAAEQTKCLYGRKVTAQFPPNGFEIGDSFYIREVPVEQDPFRRYLGVCAPGQSVKTALLRVYSIRRKKGFYVTGTVRYKAPYDEKVHDGSLY